MQPGDLQIEDTGFNFFMGPAIKNKNLKEKVQTRFHKNVRNWLTHMPHHSAVKVNTMTSDSASVTVDIFK